MKKRILSAILVSALVLSMAGCNGETPTSEPVSQQSQTSTSENKEQSSSTSEAVSSESTSSESTSASSSFENTSTSTNSESIPSASSSSENNPSSSSSSSSKPVSSSSTTSTKPVVPTNQPSIIVSSDFGSEDTWVFVTSNGQYYAFSLSTNKIYEIDDTSFYGGEYICTMGQLLYYCNRRLDLAYIKNASTKKTVWKRYDSDYNVLSFDWRCDRILVSKIETGFSGNKFLVGVMNSKMEWVYPFTEISIDGISAEWLERYSISLVGDNLVFLGNPAYVYSFKNKSLTPILKDGWDSSSTLWNDTGDQIFVLNNNGFWCFNSNNENGIFYDKYTLVKPYNVYSPGGNVYSPSGNVIAQNGKKYYALDGKTMKELSVYDLSAYNVQFIIDSTKDRIMFTAFNPNGDAYTIIMNKDGSLVTEPILGDQGISFCDDNAILKNNTIINCKTGQTTKVDYEIKQVYSAYGMMVVCSGKNYYLVKPSEPNKLLSPFAIGQRV